MRLVDHMSQPLGKLAGNEGDRASLKHRLAQLRRVVHQRKLTVIAIALFACVLAIAGSFVTTPRFTATTSMLIDPRPTPDPMHSGSVTAVASVDEAAFMASQVEILKSERLARTVMINLNLKDDEEFTGKPAGVFPFGDGWFGKRTSQGDPDEHPIRGVLDTFSKRLSVRQVGISYILEISYQSEDRHKAARIVNELADVFVDDELQSRFRVTKRATEWFQGRLKELRMQGTNSARALHGFKAENRSVESGGHLIYEQQLADLSSQLMLAKDSASLAKAKRDRMEQVMASGADISRAIPDVMSNEVITKLRAQYQEMAKSEPDWASRFGNKHQAVVELRNQMKAVQRSVADELSRISASIQSDYEIAAKRQEAIERTFEEMIGQSAVSYQAQIKGRELDSKVAAFRLLYDNFLQRYMLAAQQQTFPIAQRRVISEASVPNDTSSPNALLVLAAALIFGALSGLATALIMEAFDKTVRTPCQLESALGVDCLGVMPLQRLALPWLSKKDVMLAILGKRVQQKSITLPDCKLIDIYRNDQFSRFSETLRAIKGLIDSKKRSGQNKVIGFVATKGNEGTTISAINFARFTASLGQRTILIDAHFNGSDLTRLMAPEAKFGIIEVLGKKRRLEEAVVVDAGTKFDILPCPAGRRISHSSGIVSSKLMAQMLDELRRRYDYIVLDFPPCGSHADAAAAADIVDGFIMLAAWGSTSLPDLIEITASSGLLQKKILGTVLTLADPDILGKTRKENGRYEQCEHLEIRPLAA